MTVAARALACAVIVAAAAACKPADAPKPPPATDAPQAAPATSPSPAAAPPAPSASSQAPAADAAFEGMWMGVASGQRPVDLILIVERKDGALVAQAAVPAFGSLGDAMPDLAIRDGVLTGSLAAMVGQMRLELALRDGVLDGALLATPPGVPDPIKMPLRMERTIDARSAKDAKAWAGQLDAGAQQIVMGITLAPTADGRWAGAVDIPAQGLGGLPMYVQRTEQGAVTARIPVPGDPTFRLAPDGDGLRGTFTQGTFEAPIAFKPHAVGTALPAPVRKARPQDPVPPLPYEERTVRITVPDGHTLEGTYTVPAGASAANRVPGVVLVTGSGPQDRDESIMGHRPFAVLADMLARRGIAVLRCDDRGVGNSTGEFGPTTVDGFASDAAFAFYTLAAKPEVDIARTGIIGHSEGATAAALAVAQVDRDPQAVAKVAFLVSMAGAGVDGDAVLREQNVRLLRTAGRGDQDIAPAVAAHGAFLDAAKQGAADDVLRAKARELILAQVKANGGNPEAIPPATLDAQAQQTADQIKSAWSRRFLELDPRTALRAVTCPVLVLNGSLDVQVPVEQNVPPIEAALKDAGVPVTVKVLPGLNHLFQPAKTGTLAEYGQIDTTIDPSVPEIVGPWILAQPPRPPPASK